MTPNPPTPERLKSIVTEAHCWDFEDLSQEETKLLSKWLNVTPTRLRAAWRGIQAVSQTLYPGQKGKPIQNLRGDLLELGRKAGIPAEVGWIEIENRLLTHYNSLAYAYQRFLRKQEQIKATPKQLSLIDQ